jgi:hypothetical protein
VVSRRLEDASDAELLALRLRDLRLDLGASLLGPRVERLLGELSARGIRFRPHLWLSTEFFSPDGVPGVALPFHLASRRLIRLERELTGHVEGTCERDCMRILRHETGHALDTALKLYLRPDWRRTFGRRSEPYRRHFRVDPARRGFVRNLPRWYAQSHPAEDFAETFAVWLDPGSRWRRTVDDPLAREKLEVVDRMFAEVGGGPARVTLRERTESLARLPGTLADHYARKRRILAREPEPPYQALLVRSFEPGGAPDARSAAARFVEGQRSALARRVRGPCAGDAWSIDQAVDGMVLRCRELGLGPPRRWRRPSADELARTVERTLRALASGRFTLHR